jgi:3-oxoacyl-[acyl-carrier protein] reductase
MMKRRYGRIINITSIIGTTGNAGQSNYAAAKAGLTGLSKSLAQEVATRNITVNCIAPGYIETKMTQGLPEQVKQAILGKIPMQKIGSADDVANSCVFLASQESSYITGQTLHVNGGMYM